jgi:hypothetical protein
MKKTLFIFVQQESDDPSLEAEEKVFRTSDEFIAI